MENQTQHGMIKTYNQMLQIRIIIMESILLGIRDKINTYMIIPNYSN